MAKSKPIGYVTFYLNEGGNAEACSAQNPLGHNWVRWLDNQFLHSRDYPHITIAPTRKQSASDARSVLRFMGKNLDMHPDVRVFPVYLRKAKKRKK